LLRLTRKSSRATAREEDVMTNPVTIVILAALAVAIAGCAGGRPEQVSGASFATLSNGTGVYGSWRLPIRVFE
jgi:hypothetical protein